MFYVHRKANNQGTGGAAMSVGVRQRETKEKAESWLPDRRPVTLLHLLYDSLRLIGLP